MVTWQVSKSPGYWFGIAYGNSLVPSTVGCRTGGRGPL